MEQNSSQTPNQEDESREALLKEQERSSSPDTIQVEEMEVEEEEVILVSKFLFQLF